MAYMRLGDLLIAAGTITRQQLDDALTLQKQTGERLGDVLIENGTITERQLIDALQMCIRDRHLVKLRGKLQHAPALSHAQIARENKEKRCVLELELAAPMPGFERAQRCAVFARVLAPPEGMAALVGRPERAVRLQIQNMVRIGIDQPHHGEQLPQVMQNGSNFAQRRVAARRRLQYARDVYKRQASSPQIQSAASNRLLPPCGQTLT